MKITNKVGLPQAFVELAKSDYTTPPNEYRVTSLLKGTKEAILEKRHYHETEQDVSDMVWLVLGSAVHLIAEKNPEQDSEFKEVRLKEEIDGLTVSGKFDLFDGKRGVLTDYKTCSVWKVIYGDFSDWERQLMIYAYLLHKAGFTVNKCEIIALMKDHSKRDAKNKAGYPQRPVQKITFECNDRELANIEIWLKAKIAEIKKMEQLIDDDIPECTEEERYNSGSKFAVKSKGRKTALRVLDSKEEAEQWIKDNSKGDFVEERKGEDKKCMDYCSVCNFCSHYKSLQGEVDHE